MKIQLDENNYVVGFAIVGDIENSIETALTMDDFNELPLSVCKYENGKLILDEERKIKWEEEQNRPEPPEPEYITYDELVDAIKKGVNSYGI